MAENNPFDLQGVDPGKRLGDIQGLAKGISECCCVETQDAVSASTTQTQAGGTDVNRALIRVTHTGSLDAVSLNFKALAGRSFTIINDGGDTLSLFPFTGDKINDAAQDAQVTIANNTISEYFCPVLGLWFGGATAFET